MTRRHIHLLILLTAVAIAPGCAGAGKYFHNRALDAIDCVGFQAGIGWNIPFSIGVEVTPYVPIGLGLMSGPDGYGTTWGFAGRNVGNLKLSTWDLPFNLILLASGADVTEGEFYDGGTWYYNYSVQGWNNRRYGRLGAHCGVLLFYATADMEAVEIADFFTGIFGYDLTGDDGSPIAHQNGDLSEFDKAREKSK